MDEDNLDPQEMPLDIEEIDLEEESADKLESAMQEALEAVEQSERTRATALPAEEPAAETESADSDVARLQAEISDLRDRTIRTLADFDNYRKRVERERQVERRFAALEVCREILGVVDNLERAAGSQGPADDLRTGVELILRQVVDLLRGFGVRRIEAVGLPFDPELHEAVTRHEDPAARVPTVSEELQAGYQMYDRLLRPSVVKVAMPAEHRAGDPETRDDGDEEGG